MTSWIDEELVGCEFRDARLVKRFKTLVEQLSQAIGETIPMACQDWASTKAAYRFFSNERVDEQEILSGHFQASRDRFNTTDGLVLVLHDTTTFSFQRDEPGEIGATFKVNSGKDKAGRLRQHTVCGILMHSSLIVTLEGLPLGLCAIKFWTRKQFKGTNALKKRINPTRVTIEEKQSIRGIKNIKQATNLLQARNDVFISAKVTLSCMNNFLGDRHRFDAFQFLGARCDRVVARVMDRIREKNRS